LNALRSELGLPAVSQVSRWSHSRWCVACLFPEWYCPSQADWPGNLIQTDFPLWDEHEQREFPEDVETFLSHGEPPIVFTPGSGNVFGQEFFQAAVDACQRLGRRGLLLTRFREQIPSDLPSGVSWFSYVPFDLLLRRSAAVVHHGGIGSTAEGLAAGVPQLMMPMAYDQFDNADRVRQLGVGDWIKRSRFTGEAVARALDRLLSSASVAASCARLTPKLASRDGCERIAAALETKASEA
jgi:UDP:flavonoid glycosyltransferase YjiC (YdhE family)